MIGAGAVVFGRYDIFPPLATFLAVEAARKDKWGRGLGVGRCSVACSSSSPSYFCLGFLLAEHARTGRWAFRRAIAACVPVVVVACLQSLLSPGSVLSPVRYELKRGFELESVAGSLTLLTDPLHVKWMFAYGGWEIFGRYHEVISVLVLLPMVAGILAVWRLAARGRLSVEATSLAMISCGDTGRQGLLTPVPDLARPLVGLLAA